MVSPGDIRVRYENGVLKSLEAIEAREGEEFEVIVVRRGFSGFYEKAGKHVYEVGRYVIEEFTEEWR